MDSIKLAIIGLKNFMKDWSLLTSFIVRLTSVFSFEKDCIVLTYVNSCIILVKTMAGVDLVITLLQTGNNFLDQGSINKYLGLLIQDID
jgi:hypothetical protein